MKYKVGDKVRIKSLDWYNKNKDEYGYIDYGTYAFFPCMSQFCGKTFEIAEVHSNCYNVKEVYARTLQWTDEMIEGLVEEEVGLVDNLSSRWVNEFELPDGYIFKDENGNVINATKIVLEKKKKDYPKTYEECVHVLEGENRMSLEQMNTFRKLIDARNAYWKIAGEEMGLGKPWKPDYTNTDEKKFSIWVDLGEIRLGGPFTTTQMVLSFPTEEMRDAFYENFKEEIESVKELL